MTTLIKDALIKSQTDQLKMSYEEFLAWANEDTYAEWVNGEVIVFMSAKDFHQNMVEFLYELLSLFVRLLDLGKVRLAPYEMKLAPDGSAREPDILFVTKVNLDQITEHRLVGPADLIIEVISTDSVSRDRNHKFYEYRDAGVREYWIIDPRPGKCRADFYYLDESGEYLLFATEDDERVESRLLDGFWLRPDWLWQANKLNPLTCVLEIKEVASAISQQIEQVRKNDTN